MVIGSVGTVIVNGLLEFIMGVYLSVLNCQQKVSINTMIRGRRLAGENTGQYLLWDRSVVDIAGSRHTMTSMNGGECEVRES